MQRMLLDSLLTWRKQINRKPLLLRGARQVGKTHLINELGQRYFTHFVSINFELQREYFACFNTLQPEKIINGIKALSRQPIEPGKTLVFLDEIQECPKAIMALRYFKEQMPELHIIAAGSLLEFALNNADFRMPVGRVQSMYLKPMTFLEFLVADGYHDLAEAMTQASIAEPLEAVLHEKLLALLHEYFVTGGMPEVVANYIQSKDIQRIPFDQAAILTTYRNDFGKYASQAKHKYLQAIFDKAPGLIGEHFKYASVDAHMQARDLKSAIELLKEAGVIYSIYASKASGLPLNALINEKKFKLLFVDLGLVQTKSLLDPNLLMSKDIMLINRGALAEQFVGQELLAYHPNYLPAEVYYWQREQRSSTAEVDYIFNVDEHIIPIEVKAGATGRLKSLQIFLQEKQSPLGIKISQEPLQRDQHVLSIPLYMISELRRLVVEDMA